MSTASLRHGCPSAGVVRGSRVPAAHKWLLNPGELRPARSWRPAQRPRCRRLSTTGPALQTVAASSAAAEATTAAPSYSTHSWLWTDPDGKQHRINWATAGCGKPVVLVHGVRLLRCACSQVPVAGCAPPSWMPPARTCGVCTSGQQPGGFCSSRHLTSSVHFVVQALAPLWGTTRRISRCWPTRGSRSTPSTCWASEPAPSRF